MPHRQMLQPPPARYRITEIYDPWIEHRRFARAVVTLQIERPTEITLVERYGHRRLITMVPVKFVRGGPVGETRILAFVRLNKIKDRPTRKELCHCDAYPFMHRRSSGKCPL